MSLIRCPFHTDGDIRRAGTCPFCLKPPKYKRATYKQRAENARRNASKGDRTKNRILVGKYAIPIS